MTYLNKMETKVVICDECKKQVAEDKCRICNRDICKRCRVTIAINLLPQRQSTYTEEEKNYSLGKCFICKACKKSLKVLVKKEHQDIIQKIVEYVKNEIVIGELEGEKDEKIKMTSTITINKPSQIKSKK